jgi:ferredoxin--NADP+ reductase
MHTADKHALGEIQLFPTKITQIDDLGNGAYVFYFKRFFNFTTGQVVAISIQKQDPPRLYSIASGEKENELAILFKVKPDGFLTPRLAQKKAGDSIFVSHAFGAFYGTADPDYWIAAGTGIAPFRSMLKSGLAENKTLIFGGRTEESFYFHQEFKDQDGLHYIPCSSVMTKDGFYAGRLTEYLKTTEMKTDRNYFVCGSSEMVVQVRDILIGKGVEYDQIIAEIYF